MDSELNKPFKFCFYLFKKLGMWQNGKQSWRYFILGFSAHFVAILFTICHFIFAFKSQNLIDFTDSIGLAMLNLAAAFKCWNFFIKISKIEKLFESLKELLEFTAQSDTKRDKLKSQVNFGFKVFKAFLFTASVTDISAFIQPVFFHKLSFKIWFPFDTETSEIGFWIAATFIFLIGPFLSTLDVILDILPVIFMSFGVGLIDELAERLSETGKVQKLENPIMKAHKLGESSKANLIKVDRKVEESLRKFDQLEELKKCIEIHKKIKEFSADIASNFSVVILIQGVFSSIILCTTAFTVSVVK
jgi:hypothetical protein